MDSHCRHVELVRLGPPQQVPEGRVLKRLSSCRGVPCIRSGNLRRVTRVGPVLIVVAVCAVGGTMMPLGVQAQSEEGRPAETLDTLEALLGWPAPDPELATDVRVMTRSALSIAPLPLIRLTGGEDNHVTASVTEWGTPDVGRPDGRVLFFKYVPLACADDRSICAGTPRVIRTP